MGMAKDAELLLRNTVEIVGKGDEFAARERVAARADLLLHIVQNPQVEPTSNRMVKLAKEMLKDPDMRELENEQAAYCHLIVGLAFFLSDQVPYIDAKTQLKYSLVLAKGSPRLQAITLHNLAVLNYCELTDHNERVLSGEDPDADD